MAQITVRFRFDDGTTQERTWQESEVRDSSRKIDALVALKRLEGATKTYLTDSGDRLYLAEVPRADRNRIIAILQDAGRL